MKPILILRSSLLIFVLNLFLQTSQAQNEKFNHKIYSELLKKYVNDEGLIDYQRLKLEGSKLEQYLKFLSQNAPDSTVWSVEQQVAYWLNLYNAFTTQLILKYYPLESIQDIGTKISIFFADNAWDIEFVNIGNQLYTLDHIENEILRKRFSDPRIHFALVCASKSCPKLRREAYTGEKLNIQLEEQDFDFINDNNKNYIGANSSQVSEIFEWYKKDFTKGGTLIEYLNRYSVQKLDSASKISYLPFDWSLNEWH